MNKIDVHRVFAEYFQGSEALAYSLSKTLEEGSICLDVEKYLNDYENASDKEAINPFIEGNEKKDDLLKINEHITEDVCVLKPFVLFNNRVYLHRYFQYETQIVENINRFGDNLKIITGGPGTGKTWSVSKELIKLFEGNSNLSVALTAPTGKASVRMSEAIADYVEKNEIKPDIKLKLNKLKASTIQILLGYIRGSVFFRHDKQNLLPYDVVVVDECSMIDIALMAKLMNAVKDSAKVFLLGDKDQLSSVEAGSVFGDICRASESNLLKNKVQIQNENFRAKNSPKLIEFSKNVIDGDYEFVLNYANNDEVIIDKEFSDNLFKEFAKHYVSYIKEENISDALEKLNDIRFLCATREHKNGVEKINSVVEKFLKEEINDIEIFNPNIGFYHNQPIIITQNDYILDIRNGDVGLIRKDNETKLMTAYFKKPEGGVRKIPAGYLNAYKTVFAMTIHKSQGSEFKNVAVILPDHEEEKPMIAEKLLTRELFYTGITRAKNKVLIQSSERALKKCMKNSVSRASGIEKRLNGNII